MTKRSLMRMTFSACLLAAAVVASRATVVGPIEAIPFRFSTGTAQSTVEVIISNQNAAHLSATLTLVLDQANGVPRIVVVPVNGAPPGNSVKRVLVPGSIVGIRYAKLSNVLLF